MPGQRFTVQLETAPLPRLDVAVAVAIAEAAAAEAAVAADKHLDADKPFEGGGESEGDKPSGRKLAADAKHHGARDNKQAARQRSEQARAGRAAGAGGGRSYAFRRS